MMSSISGKFVKSCQNILREIAIQSGIHGLKHVANSFLHPIERISWLLLVILAFIGAIYVSLAQFHRFVVNPTVVSLERVDNNIDGYLPAATLCYRDRLDTYLANDFIRKEWDINIDSPDYFYFMAFLYTVMNATITSYADLAQYTTDDRFLKTDMFLAAKAINRNFEQTIISHRKNRPIEIWPIMTEKGFCYTFNSPLSETLSDKTVFLNESIKPLSCYYRRQQCFLKIDITEMENTPTIAIHSPFEVITAETDSTLIQKSDEFVVTYNVLETVADSDLRDLTPTQRKCVFSNEKTEGFQVYSKTLCIMKCRALKALELCDCIPLFYPFVDGPFCTPLGYACLLTNKWPPWELDICKCPSTCTEVTYSVYTKVKKKWAVRSEIPFEPLSTFRWAITPPKYRIRRDVIFSFEDLLVSFGGAVGLFLGFSLWSISEATFVVLKHTVNGIAYIFNGVRKVCWQIAKK